MAFSPGVNALGYLSPTFSLRMPWAFRQVGVSSSSLLLVGTALVVVANVLINAGPWVKLLLGSLATRLSRFLGPRAGFLGCALVCVLTISTTSVLVLVLGDVDCQSVAFYGATSLVVSLLLDNLGLCAQALFCFISPLVRFSLREFLS